MIRGNKKSKKVCTKVKVINEFGIPFNVTYEKEEGCTTGLIKIYDARKQKGYKIGGNGTELGAYFCSTFRKQNEGLWLVNGDREYYLDKCCVDHIKNCLLQ